MKKQKPIKKQNKVSTKRTSQKTTSMKPTSKKQSKSQRKLPTTQKKKSIPIGQTLESNDIYLPHKTTTQSKARPVIVVDKKKNKQGDEELAVVPGSTQNTPNTKYYGKNGIKYYRKSLEVEDDEGNPIKEGQKFKKTSRCTQLPLKDVKEIKDQVLNHSKRSSENRKNYSKFQKRK